MTDTPMELTSMQAVSFTGTDVASFNAMLKWLEGLTEDQRVAALMIFVCHCEELGAREPTALGASNFLFSLTASLYKSHFHIYGIKPEVLKGIVDGAYQAAVLDLKPAANQRPF